MTATSASNNSKKFFICATPLGNPDDISKRALEVLKSADFIACEDTRVTKMLLNNYQIKTNLLSYHDHNKTAAAKTIVQKILNGETGVLVSDAGTPGISDPGYYLINQFVENNIEPLPLPGPSAVITALSISGLPTDKFIFEGFLPRKEKELTDYLNSIKSEIRTLVFYESPHRLLKSLELIAREMTKKYEEYFRGTTPQALEHFKDKAPKGEFVIVIEGVSKQAKFNLDKTIEMATDLKNSDLSNKDILVFMKKHFGISRNELYNFLSNLD
jgi:16S rRNA (cytidine1402-2'-O)-methyltransferase